MGSPQKSHGERVPVELFSKVTEASSDRTENNRCFPFMSRRTQGDDSPCKLQANVRDLTPTSDTGPSDGMMPLPKGSKRPLRLWCHIYLHMQVKGFELVPM